MSRSKRDILDTEKFAYFIKGLGFKVYIAKSGSYGFITDDTESRVLSFSFTAGGSLSGNYGPPSTQSGTGWRMNESPYDLKTAEDVRKALYANPPDWIRGRGWKYLSSVKQYLGEYGSSSGFTEI
jgi:hypothetical protein